MATNNEIIRMCRRKGWIVCTEGSGHWWKIIPPWMTWPQGVSAKSLRRAYRYAREFLGGKSDG